jgi:hypothetical protein
MATFAERIEALGNDEFLDSIIVAHGFTPYGRDYDVTLLTVAALPPDVPIGDTTGTYVDGRYRYRFTHVPETHLRSAVEPRWWRDSWDDIFIDYEAWQAAGTPEGFVWGTERAEAYPGLSYVANSERAQVWSQAIGREMYEVMIETDVFVLDLVCHDVQIHRTAVGDARTRTLIELEKPEPQ